MKYTNLSNTDIKLSSVTLGCMTFTGDSNWGPQDEKDSIETIRAALDAGIVSFDTAEGYADGLSDRILGKALGADDVVLVLKALANVDAIDLLAVPVVAIANGQALLALLAKALLGRLALQEPRELGQEHGRPVQLEVALLRDFQGVVARLGAP